MVGMTIALLRGMVVLIAIGVLLALIVAWIHKFAPAETPVDDHVDVDLPPPSALPEHRPVVAWVPPRAPDATIRTVTPLVEIAFPPYIPPIMPNPTPIEPETEPETDDETEETIDDSQWWDHAKCWGCPAGCKRRNFKPYAGQNIGAEIRGASASRARADRESPGAYHGGFAPESQTHRENRSTVDDLWSDYCQRCGEIVRERMSGPSVVDGLDVVVEGSPF